MNLDGARSVSAFALRGLVSDRARALSAAGVGDPTHLVALTPRLDVESVVTLFALFSLEVPVALVDARGPPLLRLQPAFMIEGDTLRALPAPRRVQRRYALCVATSGSTGTPKLIAHTRAGIDAAIAASVSRIGLGPDDRYALALPPSHVGGVSILFRMARTGGTAVLGPAGSFDPRAFVAHLATHQVTVASIVPTMLARIVEAGLALPASLRALIVGGASCPAALRARAIERGLPVRFSYGMSETFGMVSCEETVGRGDATDVGPPLPGYAITEARGLLRVRLAGPSAFLLADETPLADERDELATLDRGAVRDGRVFVHGRADDCIVTGGENVDPRGVEDALRCAGVRDVVVLGVPDETWGERVAAIVVVTGDLAMDAVRERARALPSFARPRVVLRAEAIPRGPMGKLDRGAALAMLGYSPFASGCALA